MSRSTSPAEARRGRWKYGAGAAGAGGAGWSERPFFFAGLRQKQNNHKKQTQSQPMTSHANIYHGCEPDDPSEFDLSKCNFDDPSPSSCKNKTGCHPLYLSKATTPLAAWYDCAASCEKESIYEVKCSPYVQHDGLDIDGKKTEYFDCNVCDCMRT